SSGRRRGRPDKAACSCAPDIRRDGVVLRQHFLCIQRLAKNRAAYKPSSDRGLRASSYGVARRRGASPFPEDAGRHQKKCSRKYAPDSALFFWYWPSTTSPMRCTRSPSESFSSRESQSLPHRTLMTFHPPPRKIASSS